MLGLSDRSCGSAIEHPLLFTLCSLKQASEPRLNTQIAARTRLFFIEWMALLNLSHPSTGIFVFDVTRELVRRHELSLQRLQRQPLGLRVGEENGQELNCGHHRKENEWSAPAHGCGHRWECESNDRVHGPVTRVAHTLAL